jgi:hypothetical protein
MCATCPFPTAPETDSVSASLPVDALTRPKVHVHNNPPTPVAQVAEISLFILARIQVRADAGGPVGKQPD